MKVKVLCALALSFSVSTVQAQTLKEKMAAKMEKSMNKNKKTKTAVPFEGDFSDESGISGAYYPTSELLSENKTVTVAKVDYNGASKLTMHLEKDEAAPSVFYISDFHKYALETYGHYEFEHKRTLYMFSVEPGVMVLGATKNTANGYIADTIKFKPVVLVKDSTMKSKYTYEDAKTLLAEGMTKQEKYNRERNSGATKMADVGGLTSNKQLMSECWKTIEAALSKKPDWNGELSNYQMHYIYEKQFFNTVSVFFT